MAGQDGKITTESAIPRECIVQVIIIGLENREVKVANAIHGALQDGLSNKEKRERANYDHLFIDIAETYGHNNKKYLSPLSSIHQQSQSNRPTKRPPAEASRAMGSSSEDEAPRKKPDRNERPSSPIHPPKAKPEEKPTSPTEQPNEQMVEVEVPVEEDQEEEPPTHDPEADHVSVPSQSEQRMDDDDLKASHDSRTISTAMTQMTVCVALVLTSTISKKFLNTMYPGWKESSMFCFQSLIKSLTRAMSTRGLYIGC